MYALVCGQNLPKNGKNLFLPHFNPDIRIIAAYILIGMQSCILGNLMFVAVIANADGAVEYFASPR